MPGLGSISSSKATTRRLVLTGMFAGLFAISTLIPVSVFIGGAGFITLEIVLLPIIAFLLEPWQAFGAALFGSAVAYAFGLGLAPVFGPFSLLISPLAAYLGSVAFHYDEKWFKWSSPIWLALPLSYIGFGIIYYLLYSKGPVVWLTPYALAVIAVLYRPFAKDVTGKIAIGCLATAICEQVGMNVASISLAGLVGPIWLAIAPFMFTERTIATVGSLLAIKAVLRMKPPFLKTSP